MQNPRNQLHLYQELTLLALKDTKGTVSISYVAQILAGALLAELIETGRITTSDSKKNFVEVLNTESLGDPLLDECLAMLASSQRRVRITTWVSRFASIKRLHHRAAETLCEKGILKKSSSKVLLVFNRTVYPEVDPVPEQKIKERLESAILSEKENLSTRDTLLVAFADASGALNQIFGRKELKPHRKRIKRISAGETAAKATREVIVSIQATIAATTAIAATAAATS